MLRGRLVGAKDNSILIENWSIHVPSLPCDRWVPSHKYGLPLTPSGDSCRTSRLALRQIALVRPQAVVTSVAKEVARYNNLATNAQALNVNIAQHVLTRSKAEILHLVELLIAKVREGGSMRALLQIRNTEVVQVLIM